MARLLTDAEAAPSTSSTTADVMGEASEPRSKVQNVTSRRLSFKTRQTPSKNYRSTKVTLSSNNVSLIASKFNTIIIEDDKKGRALLRRINSTQRKPKTVKNVTQSEGTVKAAIQIFEQEPDVEEKTRIVKPKLILVRKQSSNKLHKPSVSNVITQNSAKEVSSAKQDSETNQLSSTKETVRKVDFQRKPSLKAKPQLRNLNRPRYASDLGVNFNQRVAKFNNLDGSKDIDSVKNVDTMKNRRSLGYDISQRIEKFNMKDGFRFGNKEMTRSQIITKNEEILKDVTKNTKTPVESITVPVEITIEKVEEKKENSNSLKKLTNSVEEENKISEENVKPLTANSVERTNERAALNIKDSNTKPKVHPKPNVTTPERKSPLYNEKLYSTQQKSLKVFKTNSVPLREHKENDTSIRLSIPRDPTILENVFDSDEPKEYQIKKTVGLVRPNNSFLWKSSGTLCVTEIPIIDEIESKRVTEIIDVRKELKERPPTKPKTVNGFKNAQISIVNGAKRPVEINGVKTEIKYQTESNNVNGSSQLISSTTTIHDFKNENVLSEEKEKFINSLNMDVADSFMLEMNEQIEKRFNCDFSNYELIYNKTEQSQVISKNKSVLHSSGPITSSVKQPEQHKSSEDIQKLLVEELVTRNSSSLHRLTNSDIDASIANVKPTEKQKSTEDIQKLLVEELVSRNSSSLHRLTNPDKRRSTEIKTTVQNIESVGLNLSPEIPHPSLIRNRPQARNNTFDRSHLIPADVPLPIERGSKIPPPVLRHLKKNNQQECKTENNSCSEEYFSSKFSQSSDDHYTLVGDEDVEEMLDHSLEAYEDIGEQENSYAVIKEYEDEQHNIYDDVLNVNGQDDLYESISPVVNITNQPDSDSSCDQNNSLYGIRPSSQNSSGGVYQITGPGYQPTPRSETSDEWMDLDNSDDQNEQVLVYRDRPAPRAWSSAGGWSQKVRRQWSKRATAHVGIKSTSNIYLFGLSDTNGTTPVSPALFNGNTKGLVSLRSILFFGHTYEAQEVSLFLGKEDGSDSSGPHPYEHVDDAETAICDDFDDSFDSDSSADDAAEVCPKEEKHSRVLPEPPREGIYGFMKQAGQRMRKHWSLGKSLRIGKKNIRSDSSHQTSSDQGQGNITVTSLSRKRWPSFKSKFKPPVQNKSTFYLNSTSDDSEKHKVPETTSVHYGESKVDPRRLSTASMIRPSSPPPPPPPPRNPTSNASNRSSLLDDSERKTSIQSEDGNKKISSVSTVAGDDGRKRESMMSNLTKELVSTFDKIDTNGTYAEGQQRLTQTTNSNWYLDISWPSTDSASDHGSSQGSDFQLTFADEPLYQFYTADIAEMSRSELNCDDSDGYEEIASLVHRPSAMDLITPHHRTLWCEINEVKESGILDQLSQSERKLQEAKFEVMTSEASYFKSMTVLDKHFASCPIFADETILPSQDRKILFSNVSTVRKCSEKLLAALEKCWQNSILLSGLCKILYEHVQSHFYIYVKYCSNQIYLDKTLKQLRSTNNNFNDILIQLEADSQCQSLSLHSFLMLPMQRITRMPLLVDAILSRLSSTDPEFTTCEVLLATLNKIVSDCNEGARRQERYEEMLKLSQQLEFNRDVRTLPVLSPLRWLVRSGQLTQVNMDVKLTFSRRLSRAGPKITLFLFTDLLIVAKKKGDESYLVVDHCQRNLVQMSEMKDMSGNNRYLLILTMLENHEMKTVELMLCCESETVRQRWLQAVTPPTSSNPDETLYEDWDCPQVSAVHVYSGGQSDELSLQLGDVVNVLRKMADGWYYGQRMRDGETGWFPANHTVEIASMHVRAKNLKQRWRFLALSGNYVEEMKRKTKI